MSLPPGFGTPEEYFEKILEFFHKYQHFYNFSNVDVLVENVLDEIDVDSLEMDILKSVNEDCLKNLSWFLQFEEELKTFQTTWPVKELTSWKSPVPLSEKKKQEIISLSETIHTNCMENNLRTVVDVGCGLGYLSEIIHDKFKLNVLAIDNNEQCIKSAKKRQQKYHKTNKVFYWRYNVDHTSTTQICEKVKEIFPENFNFCLVGLHACADLTVDSIRMFKSMVNARSMVIMPCCYHKMAGEILDDGGYVFDNFPLSKSLRVACERWNYSRFLRIPFLRLATQPSFITSSLEDAAFRLLSRATLQYYAKSVEKEIIKTRRKAVNVNKNNQNFDEYIEVAIQDGYRLKCHCQTECQCDNSIDSCHLKSIWKKWDANSQCKASILILVQNFLQPVFENFVLFDRLVFLNELGFDNCQFLKIVNEKISPRCFALVVNK